MKITDKNCRFRTGRPIPPDTLHNTIIDKLVAENEFIFRDQHGVALRRAVREHFPHILDWWDEEEQTYHDEDWDEILSLFTAFHGPRPDAWKMEILRRGEYKYLSLHYYEVEDTAPVRENRMETYANIGSVAECTNVMFFYLHIVDRFGNESAVLDEEDLFNMWAHFNAIREGYKEKKDWKQLVYEYAVANKGDDRAILFDEIIPVMGQS